MLIPVMLDGKGFLQIGGIYCLGGIFEVEKGENYYAQLILSMKLIKNETE